MTAKDVIDERTTLQSVAEAIENGGEWFEPTQADFTSAAKSAIRAFLASPEMKQIRDHSELIKVRCGTEMDYGSSSDAVQNGYILAGEIIASIDKLIGEVK
jgi:hypothetical protein